MALEAVCPRGHSLQITEAHVGQRINCPICGEAFVAAAGTAGQWSSPVPPDRAAVRLDPGAASAGAAGLAGLHRFSLAAGRPMLAVGLLLVLVSRGCDTIGKRSVDRAQMKEKILRAQFDDEWDARRMDFERRIAAIQDKEKPSPEDPQLLADLRKSLADLQTARQKAQKVFEEGTLRDANIAARDALANNGINAYWREIFFVFATLVLAAGLLAVSWTAQGAERWVCLIMLAIITFSVYVIGIAWTPLPG